MDSIQQYFSIHPLAIMVLVFVGLLLVYFIFKQLIKMAIVLIVLLLALAGYFYFKSPGNVWENMKGTLQKAKTEAGGVVEKGKAAYTAGKNLYEKGKTVPGDIKKFLDKNGETHDRR
ncbi:MAG: hypothetical protein HY742_02820 [Deltaproteobacteria bacterium]|nr:hypothetical protein [Deltaproteobacteria bacterium]